MEAIRETHEVLGGSVTIRLPAGFAARRVEVIVLPAADEGAGGGRPRQRLPAPELAGTVIRDDLIEPAVTPGEWDALLCRQPRQAGEGGDGRVLGIASLRPAEPRPCD